MSSNGIASRGSESITYKSGRSGAPELRFVHYNDVYHIDASSSEPAGGIARFQTVCNYYRHGPTFKDQPTLLTLFSGDAFNPSLESSVTKGAHMVDVLNAFETDVATVGNHDLDFGVEKFEHLASQCRFPWLLANVTDPALGSDVPMGNARKTVLLTASNGLKVGIIGLVEREWLATINSLPPNIVYKSATATVKELAPQLRSQGADIIIALTHAREPNDNKLAEQTPPGMLDLILGGHDHFYGHSIINGTHCLRSGTDFKQLSYLQAWRKPDGKGWDFDITRRDIVRSTPKDPNAAALVEKISSGLRARLEKPIGYTAVPLDARFTTVRLKESNIGNFISDLMRLYYGADCCLIASGTIRGDQVYPPGVIRSKDILNCFPFEDPCVVLKLPGKAILEAVENSVSTYPALEGRFPQVSNMTFSFDPKAPASQRVRNLTVAGEPYQPEKLYVLATRDYMARGKDGFTSLMPKALGGPADEIISDENGILISMLLRQYFLSLKILGRWGRGMHHLHKHFEEKVHGDLHARHPVKEPRRPSTITLLTSPGGQHSAPPQSASGGGLAAPTFKDPFTSHDGSSVPAQADESQNDEDSEDEGDNSLQQTPSVGDRRDRQLMIMRKVLRKWFRLAGLKGHPGISGPNAQIQEEFHVEMGWAKAISPRVEGRIVNLSESGS